MTSLALVVVSGYAVPANPTYARPTHYRNPATSLALVVVVSGYAVPANPTYAQPQSGDIIGIGGGGVGLRRAG